MKKKILVDLDGIVADLGKSLYEYHKVTCPYDNPENLGKWDVDKLLGFEPADFWGPLDHDFWEAVPLTEDAPLIMETVFKYVPEESVCFVTTPTLHSGSITGKHEWIKKHFPTFSRRYFIGPAKYFCAHENSFLIDDYDKNVDNFRAHGGSAFLYPRPWNSRHKSVDMNEKIHALDWALQKFTGLVLR